MNRPDDIPQDIWSVAYGIERDMPKRVLSANRPFIRSAIARAILAERQAQAERDARIVKSFQVVRGEPGSQTVRPGTADEIAQAILLSAKPRGASHDCTDGVSDE